VTESRQKFVVFKRVRQNTKLIYCMINNDIISSFSQQVLEVTLLIEFRVPHTIRNLYLNRSITLSWEY